MVGMGEVSSCVAKVAKGDKFKKGDCLGEFRLGGSSHCVIFNRNCTLDFSKSMKDAYFFDPRTGGLNSRRINVRSHLAQLVY
jgi:hypothetical protein